MYSTSTIAERCLDLDKSGKALEALAEYGKRAQILLSKINSCYDEDTQQWDELQLKALEGHLEENRMNMHRLQSDVCKGSGSKEWRPIKGE